MYDFILTLLATVALLLAFSAVRVAVLKRREFEALAQQTAAEAIHGVIEAAGPGLHPLQRVAVMRALISSTNLNADYALTLGNHRACALLNRVSEIIHEETYK